VNYKLIADEIAAQAQQVQGIGKIYQSERYVTDWKQFFDMHTDSQGRVNVLFIRRLDAQENTNGPLGAEDASSEIETVYRPETWQLTLLYVYFDDPDQSSEYFKSLIEDGLQAQFRFLQDLNGLVWQQNPLKLISSQPAMFGEVLCHKSVMTLQLSQRIINPGP
jgi:hypothetical protein